MKRLRYDLKLAFLVTSNVCVLAWGTAAMLSDGYKAAIAIPTVAVVAAFSAILYKGGSSKDATVPGVIGGFAGVAIFTVCFFAGHGIGYFFYSDTAEYFEDGAFTELVIFPPVCVLVWGGFGAIVGVVCGVIADGVRKAVAVFEAELRQKH